MDDFAAQVRAAQQAAARKQQDRQAADDRLRAEQAAAAAEITSVAKTLARALRDEPVDVVVEHLASRVKKRRLGGASRGEVTQHVLDGWVFGETWLAFHDNESRYGRTESSLDGYILATDGSVHRCHSGYLGTPGQGRVVVTVRSPWGSSVLNGPMDAVAMGMDRGRVRDALVRLAVKYRVDPARLMTR